MVPPGVKTTQVPNLIENRKEKRLRIVKKSKKPIRFVASSGGKKGDSIRIYHKGRPFLKFKMAKERKGSNFAA